MMFTDFFSYLSIHILYYIYYFLGVSFGLGKFLPKRETSSIIVVAFIFLILNNASEIKFVNFCLK